MKFIVSLFMLLFLFGCSKDEPAPTTPDNVSTHDTTLIHQPPPKGGTLSGTWASEKLIGGRTWYLSQQGLVGVYGYTYQTDLRVQGSRVWFEAIEYPTYATIEIFNGTIKGDRIEGWSAFYYYGAGQERTFGTYWQLNFVKQQ